MSQIKRALSRPDPDSLKRDTLSERGEHEHGNRVVDALDGAIGCYGHVICASIEATVVQWTTRGFRGNKCLPMGKLQLWEKPSSLTSTETRFRQIQKCFSIPFPFTPFIYLFLFYFLKSTEQDQDKPRICVCYYKQTQLQTQYRIIVWFGGIYNH